MASSYTINRCIWRTSTREGDGSNSSVGTHPFTHLPTHRRTRCDHVSTVSLIRRRGVCILVSQVAVLLHATPYSHSHSTHGLSCHRHLAYRVQPYHSWGHLASVLVLVGSLSVLGKEVAISGALTGACSLPLLSNYPSTPRHTTRDTHCYTGSSLSTLCLYRTSYQHRSNVYSMLVRLWPQPRPFTNVVIVSLHG